MLSHKIKFSKKLLNIHAAMNLDSLKYKLLRYQSQNLSFMIFKLALQN